MKKSRKHLAGARGNVIVAVVLHFVTFGLYEGYWYLRKAPFLDAATRGKRFGKTGALLFIGLVFAELALIVFHAVSGTPRVDGLADGSGNALSIDDVVRLAIGVVHLGLAFQARGALLDLAERLKRPRKVSILWTLTFNYLYLQYVINELDDHAATRPTQAPAAASDVAVE
jgi:hypothetical protein